jgi:anti-anti-sigma factor
MNIATAKRGPILELKLDGRLDAYWADQLGHAIDQAVHGGSHHLRLNLAGVTYLSSAGIRVIMKSFKELNAIQGSFFVSEASDTAAAVLELAGLSGLQRASDFPTETETKKPEPRCLESAGAVHLVYDLPPSGGFDCRVVGNPTKWTQGGYLTADCKSENFPASTLGLGVGALGNDFADCQERFGEFLAVEGVAVYLPTDGTNVPDYMMSEGLLVPGLEVLWAISGKGSFSHLLRFDAKPEPPGTLPISELAAAALDQTEAEAVLMVGLVESATLVGSCLRQSPADPRAARANHGLGEGSRESEAAVIPQSERGVAVMVGIGARRTDPLYQPFVRPLNADGSLVGRFHAALFPYRPIARGELDSHQAINALFSSEPVQGFANLTFAGHSLDGIHESQFLRGACWVAGIKSIAGA